MALDSTVQARSVYIPDSSCPIRDHQGLSAAPGLSMRQPGPDNSYHYGLNCGS